MSPAAQEAAYSALAEQDQSQSAVEIAGPHTAAC
jgi:hypothetical protein